MKIWIVVCALMMVSGCADASRCAGRLVPINAPGAVPTARAQEVTPGHQTRQRTRRAAVQP